MSRGSPEKFRDKSEGPLHELWNVKVNDPTGQRSLWLGLSVLMSENGFRRVAEAWAVHFHRNASSKEVSKTALKQGYGLTSFVSPVMPASPRQSSIRLGDCELRESLARGSVQSKGQTISWDFTISPRQEARYELIPLPLRRFRLVRGSLATIQGDAVFSGSFTVNGETFTLREAPGMQRHVCGPAAGHSWVWGHCNAFVNEQGMPTPFLFEGITTRARMLGPLPGPRISSFNFIYQNKTYAFHSIKDTLRIRSWHNLNEWRFQAERGDLLFRGVCRAEHKDFAGLTFEDTNGSLVYCSNSNLAEMIVHVYRRGKLEATLRSNGSAALEIASREKSPYVPLLI
ncbi:MAG: hypothetical protein NDJ90_02860 [Oligoflexia bacterium]|nr:hypothetical protein [Oligoflexia bacterium]